MKIIHTSDWHLGKTIKHYKLLQEQEKALQQIAQIVKEKKTDVFIHAGDIYDTTTPDKTAIQIFSEFIAQIKPYVENIIIISGNHDNEKIVSNYNKILKNLNCYIYDYINPENFNQIKINDFYFYPIPYKYERELADILQIDNEETPYVELFKRILEKHSPEDKVILITHIGVFKDEIFKNILENENELERRHTPTISSEILKKFTYVCLGHFHNFQQIEKNVVYPSSLLKYRDTEINHKKGIVFTEIENNDSIKVEFIPIDLPADFIEIKLSLGKDNEILNIEPETLPDNKTLFTLVKVENLKENTPLPEILEHKYGKKINIYSVEKVEDKKNTDLQGYEIQNISAIKIEEEILKFLEKTQSTENYNELKNILQEIFEEIKNEEL